MRSHKDLKDGVSQTRAMGYAIYYAARYMDGKRTLKEVLGAVMDDLDKEGLDILPPWCIGDLPYSGFLSLLQRLTGCGGSRWSRRYR